MNPSRLITHCFKNDFCKTPTKPGKFDYILAPAIILVVLPMHSINPIQLLHSLKQHRTLIHSLIQRDVTGRYQGSMMGIMWSLVTPILMLCIYLFVFGVVFNPRRAGNHASLGEVTLSLFCGMLVHSLFAECLGRAPGIIVGQPNYVKKVVFPLETLSVIAVGSALFHYLISLLVLLLFILALNGTVPVTACLLPVIVLPVVLLGAGISWLISALAVFLRDIGQITGLLGTILLFLSPVFYKSSSIPEQYRFLLQLNPLTIPIELSRDILLNGVLPNWSLLAVHTVASAAFCWMSYACFQKLRKGFADVL